MVKHFISLTRGQQALVDAQDFERLNHFSWYAIPARGTFYAVRAVKGKRIWMHKEVLGVFVQVDHRDGDGLNNRRGNLRPASNSQNHANQKKRTGSRSLYKGVCWEKHAQQWRAQIRKDGRSTHLGLFQSERLAAEAYDRAARLVFGNFARTNFNATESSIR